MENKIFYNGVNLVRAILTDVCTLDGLGLVGQAMVLDNLVDPMLKYLNDTSTVVPCDGEMIDVIYHKLDEEDYVIPPAAAAMAIEQERTIRRLIRERMETPKHAMARMGNATVVAINSVEELMDILETEAGKQLGEVAQDAEFELANALAEIYDLWSEEELGNLHPALYNILKMGQMACETALSKLDGRELDFDELELQREGYEALEGVNQRMDELLMDYPEYRDEATDGSPREDIWGNGPIFPFS